MNNDIKEYRLVRNGENGIYCIPNRYDASYWVLCAAFVKRFVPSCPEAIVACISREKFDGSTPVWVYTNSGRIGSFQWGDKEGVIHEFGAEGMYTEANRIVADLLAGEEMVNRWFELHISIEKD